MNQNGTMMESVLLQISGESQFSDLTFVVAYENDIKPVPLDEPIVAFSTKGCQIGPQLTTTLENGKIETTNERELETTISMDIYMPYSMGGNEAHKIFDRLATYFLFKKNYNITKSVCYETEYNKSCQAIILKSYFVFYNKVSS